MHITYLPNLSIHLSFLRSFDLYIQCLSLFLYVNVLYGMVIYAHMLMCKHIQMIMYVMLYNYVFAYNVPSMIIIVI